VIAIRTEEEWQAFADAIGSPGWIKDPKLATLKGRKEHEDELDTLVATWSISFSPEEVMVKLQRARVAAGVVENAWDLLEKDPQLKHRQYFKFLDHPEMGLCSHVDWPFHLSLTPARLRYAPLLGEHTEMVCKNILRMSDREFEDLREAGVLN